jgi:hypothetical protein
MLFKFHSINCFEDIIYVLSKDDYAFDALCHVEGEHKLHQ